MGFRLKFKDTELSLKKKIVGPTSVAVNKALTKIEHNVKVKIGNAFIELAKRDETTRSLLTGTLSAAFGFPYGESDNYVFPVLEAIAYSINFTIQRSYPKGGVNLGNATLGILSSNLKEALAAQIPVTTEKGENLPWLEWLLLAGNEILIDEFYVKFKEDTGRSELGFMRKSQREGFSVPAQYAGTTDDNWLTRMITAIGPTLSNLATKIIQESLIKELK